MTKPRIGAPVFSDTEHSTETKEIPGVLEIDHARGVIYFHTSNPQDHGLVTVLRIQGVEFPRQDAEMIDLNVAATAPASPAETKAGAEIKAPKPTAYVDVVFDGPPGPESGRFVETEDDQGHGIGSVGEWVHRPDGFWALRMPVSALAAAAGEQAEHWHVIYPFGDNSPAFVKAAEDHPGNFISYVKIVEELNAVASLRASVAQKQEQIDELTISRDAWMKEHTAVYEQNANLTDALQDAIAGWHYIRTHHGDLYGVGWDRVEEKAAVAFGLLAAAAPEQREPEAELEPRDLTPLPCRCGSTAIVYRDGPDITGVRNGYWICDSCDFHGPLMNSVIDALDAWNQVVGGDSVLTVSESAAATPSPVDREAATENDNDYYDGVTRWRRVPSSLAASSTPIDGATEAEAAPSYEIATLAAKLWDEINEHPPFGSRTEFMKRVAAILAASLAGEMEAGR